MSADLSADLTLLALLGIAIGIQSELDLLPGWSLIGQSGVALVLAYRAIKRLD